MAATNIPVSDRGSDSEDDELAALREAALRSKRSRAPDFHPSNDAVPLPAPSLPVHPVPVLSLPRPIAPLQSLPFAALDVSCPSVSHFCRHPFKAQDKVRLPRIGNQNFIRAPRSNLIVIQTVPLEEEKPVELKRPDVTSSQEKITLLRPQDKWASTDDIQQTASPAKPKAATKFDRYDGSDSDTDEEMSASDDSESGDDFSSKEYNKAVDEHENVGDPDADLEQLQLCSSPLDAFNEQECEPGSSKFESMTDTEKDLEDFNLASNDQSCEQTKDTPTSFHELSSRQLDSGSSLSSHASESQSRTEIRERCRSRTCSKSPVPSRSPVSSGSLPHSSPPSTRDFDLKDQQLLSPASPHVRRTSHSASLDPIESLDASSSSGSSSPQSYRDRQSLPHRGFDRRSHSPDARSRSKSRSKSPMRFRSPCHSRSPDVSLRPKDRTKSPESFGTPLHSRSRSRSRSPPSLKSARCTRSSSGSCSPARLKLPLRTRSRSPRSRSPRSRSPLKMRRHSRSPVDRFPTEHSPSKFRSKVTSDKLTMMHLETGSRSRLQKSVSAFHHSKSPTSVNYYPSRKSPFSSRGHVQSKNASRSPGYVRGEKMSPKLAAESGTSVSCRSTRRSRSPVKFKSFDSSWLSMQSRGGQRPAYLRSHSPSPERYASRNSSPDYDGSKLSSTRRRVSRSPEQRFSRSRSPRQSRSPLPRFSRSRSPPFRSSSVLHSLSPGVPHKYEPSGISTSRNGSSSNLYRDGQRLMDSQKGGRLSRDVGGISDDSNCRNRYISNSEHYFETSLNRRINYKKEIGNQSRGSADFLQYNANYKNNLADKRQLRYDDSVFDVRSREKMITQKSGRDVQKEGISDREKLKHNSLKGKNYELREHSDQEVLSRNERHVNKQNSKHEANLYIRKRRVSPAVAEVKPDLRLATDRERVVSDRAPIRTSIDSEIQLSRRQLSICDDSDSESEDVGLRQKHYIERKDLDTRGPLLQKGSTERLQNSRLKADDRRFSGYNHGRIVREESRARLNHIPPLIEGIQLKNAEPRRQSPRRPTKRPQSKSPPVKTVLSIVKRAKDSDSAEVEPKKSKMSSELSAEVDKKRHKTSSQSFERERVVDEIKKSQDVLTVGDVRSSSHGRSKVRTAVRNARDKISQVEAPTDDQKTIQITFNQKMNFDGNKSSRPSVHERLGSFDVASAGKDKKAVESGSSLAVFEEKNISDLRDLIGEKSRHVAYDLDGVKSAKGDDGSNLYIRHKNSKVNQRRRRVETNSTGNLEGRQLGRSKCL